MIIIIVIHRHDLSRMEIQFHRSFVFLRLMRRSADQPCMSHRTGLPTDITVCSVSESVVRGPKLPI